LPVDALPHLYPGGRPLAAGDQMVQEDLAETLEELATTGVGGSNAPEAGRRSVSWSLPAVVLDEAGRPLLGLGSPGGRRIPMILGQVLARWALHGQTLQEAVEAPRFHVEGREVQFEVLPSADVLAALGRLGYTSRSVPELPYSFGSVQALAIDHDEGEVHGARDERRDAAFDVGSG
jgi:gamma-glutamyltranspeptidase / glutathione hydrolase